MGIGPTYFAHILYRKNQSLEELRYGMILGNKLMYFPKIGGTLAVLSGGLLVILGNYDFMQLWLIGSLILYILIQVIVIGLMDPVAKKLGNWVLDPKNKDERVLPEEQKQQLSKVNRFFYGASTLGVLLFIFMILKPVI
jgi:uncharacterized membrane protein